jgi:diaminopimelate epimerase
VVDNRGGIIAKEDQAELAKKLCRRKFSLGADGLILLRNAEKADYAWDFYNADGSVAEMCGNGARCAARFAYRHGFGPKLMRLETLAGIVETEICGPEEVVKVKLTQPHDFRLDLSISLDDVDYPVAFVNTGVPHAVIFVDEEPIPVKKWGRKVRFDALFEPQGTNATFVMVKGENLLKSRSYERGVEDETMACGTGAVAAALFGAMFKEMESPVAVETSGGDVLTIHFDLQDGLVADKVYLEGPTRIICAGDLTAEALL